jgi:hypothetical protein
VSADFQIDMETDDTTSSEGWFSEASVEEILWDLFDPANEPGDTVVLGFAPIFAAMTGPLTNTDALTGIFPFITGLRAANLGFQAGINDLLDGEEIVGTDDFGAAENNDGGDAQILPIYKTISLNNPISVCSRSPDGNNGAANKLGNRVFVRFDNNAARLVAIQVDGAANGPGTTFAADPDVFVLRRGALVTAGLSTPAGPAPHTSPGHETITPFQLAAGTSIIEVYDFEIAGPQPRCMTVSITGS